MLTGTGRCARRQKIIRGVHNQGGNLLPFAVSKFRENRAFVEKSNTYGFPTLLLDLSGKMLF
jgi:hypothetical protein